MDDPTAFIRTLATKIREGGVAVWCGAGISRNAGIPVVSEFVPEVLGAIGLQDIDPDYLLRRFPFEALMDEFAWGGSIDRLLDVFDGDRPTATHCFLAQLAARGYLHDIVTTNFDQLIEDALRDAHVPFSVACDADEYDAICWDEQETRVTKIHGSVDRKDSIIATLRAVTRRLSTLSRRAIIEKLLRGGTHSTVLFLGYSFSDVFDLNPAIAAFSDTTKDVIVVEHTLLEPRLEPLAQRLEKNPFVSSGSGVRLYYDTTALVSALSRELNIVQLDSTVPPVSRWTSIVRDWARRYGPSGSGNVQAVKGRLLSKCGKFSEAITVIEEVASGAAAGIFHGDILNQLGLAYDGAQQYTKAIACFERAIDEYREEGDEAREAQSMANIASIFTLQGDFDDAIRVYVAALDLAKAAGEQQLEAADLDGLGLVARYLARHEDSVALHNEALAISEEVGDINGTALRYGNLGLSYRYLQQYDAAERCHERALRLGMELGDWETVSSQLGNLGLVYREQGRLDEAMQHHAKALEFACAASSLTAKATQLANLGVVCSNRGMFEEALHFHTEALEIEESLGRRPAIAHEYDNIAGVYAALGRIDDAMEMGELALKLYEALYGADDHRVLRLRTNLRLARGDSG